MTTNNYSLTALETLAREVFLAMGHSEKHAHTAACNLTAADRRGVDSHGVARLSGYVRLWEANRVNARPNIKIVHQTPSTANVNADKALGLVSGSYAMNLAINKANKVGCGWVAVHESNHYGIAAQYAMMALKEDMIGFSFTNASPLVAPARGKDRLLGTNPIAVAVPAGQETPFVADMATTTAANGKLETLKRKNEAAPLEWVQDKEGQSSTNPDILKEGGALLPVGGQTASHKGYGLGAMVDILSGVLSGANYGPWVPPFVSFLPLAPNMPGQGIGHFFGAMRVDAFRPAADFKKDMDNWIRTFKRSSAIDPKAPVLIPGEPETMIESQRIKEGVPLLPAVEEDLLQITKKFNLSPLQSL